MKTSKNAVLKHSFYTTALTRSLKGSERLHCRVDKEDNAVYVCSGYLLVKLTPAEYEALVQPITQREAGNYVICNGETAPSAPLDMVRILTDAAREAVHDMTPAPFTVSPADKCSKTLITPYYSESGDFVAGFNSDYAAIISASLSHKGKNPVSPMVVFSGDEPQAMILPVRLDETKSRVPAAVRAYFTDKKGAVPDETEASQLHQQYEEKCRENECIQSQLDRLQSCIADKNAEINALLERLNAQPEPKPQEAAEEDTPDQTPADKAAALVEKLATLKGITATVKGAQTSAPVVWLAGKADAHKKKIEAMGGKWSVRRSAWYFKV